MKSKSMLLIIMLMLIAFQPSFGAFPVKHAAVTTSFTKTRETTKVQAVNVRSHKQSWFVSHVANVFSPLFEQFYPERRRNDTNGLLSMIFGIIGLFPVYGLIFSIPAIILGAIGLKHDERFSLAGLILGIAGVVISIFTIVIAIVILSSFL